jgi:hypothetical protein
MALWDCSTSHGVIPAEAGIHVRIFPRCGWMIFSMDPGLRRDDTALLKGSE